MLIDNEKFIGLLAENSGLEKEKVEKYLAELIEDIRTAFEEDEGYEVDGFGIFSKLGSNILFIPSEDLATEINYKYVGMEPIELPGGKTEELEEEDEAEENPIQGILDGADSDVESQEYEDPFAELFNEAEEHEKGNKVESTDEEIEAAVEEEIENEDLDENIFSEISEEQEEELETPSLVEEEVEEALENEDQPEEKTGPEQWGIDAHKEDDQEDAFSGLFGEDADDSSEIIDEDDIFASEEELVDIESEENQQQDGSVDSEAEIDFSALEENKVEELQEDDFDDPFAELEEDSEEVEDFVPVVTNVSSDSAAKSKLQKDDVADDSGDNKTNSEPEKVELPKNPRDRKQSSPVFLYMILALVILGGAGYILAYFGIVDINGITPPKYKTQVTQATTPVNQQNNTLPQNTESEEVVPPTKTPPEVDEENINAEGASSSENNETSTNETPIEQPVDENLNINAENDLAPLVADEKAPGNTGSMTSFNEEANADTYGLTGIATEAGNNGYTIVLYTLSRKAGADAQLQKLTQDGYRTIIKERPSEQYGVLYRVSIGQFETLADAAIAAEQVDSSILGNYIITKI